MSDIMQAAPAVPTSAQAAAQAHAAPLHAAPPASTLALAPAPLHAVAQAPAAAPVAAPVDAADAAPTSSPAETASREATLTFSELVELPALPPFDARETVQEFAAMLRMELVKGVSDMHFAGGDGVWPVRYGKPLRSSYEITDEQIARWVEVFGKSKGGAEELLHGVRGSVEAMAEVNLVERVVRLRMTYRRQAAGLGMTLRVVPTTPPRITDSVFHRNPIPHALVDLTLNVPAGLILFCGPTGSGKTTINAALLAEVNETQQKHIYTVEDPIEFIHRSKMSLVSQREIGEHASDFPSALKTSLRSRPNIILVGELLDLETVRVAIEAANKGHLVFATSHASSAEEAISSLVSQFPGSEQNQVATALSQALKAVCVQRLVPTMDGELVPARELLLNTIAVSSKVRSLDFTQLTAALKPQENMWTFEDELAALWASGQIDEDAVWRYCNDRTVMRDKFTYARQNRQHAAGFPHQTFTPGASS